MSKAWGLCESCAHFDQITKLCELIDNEIEVQFKWENWPGFFIGDKCIKCNRHLYSSDCHIDIFMHNSKPNRGV
jgi:hypothetical protein